MMLYADMHPDILLQMVQAQQRTLWKEAEMQARVRSARSDRPGPYRRGLHALRRALMSYTAGTSQRYAGASRVPAPGSKQTARFRGVPQVPEDHVCTAKAGSSR